MTPTPSVDPKPRAVRLQVHSHGPIDESAPPIMTTDDAGEVLVAVGCRSPLPLMAEALDARTDDTVALRPLRLMADWLRDNGYAYQVGSRAIWVRQ